MFRETFLVLIIMQERIVGNMRNSIHPDMRYTLCFITRGNDILMLHRNSPPHQGQWNGVGGSIELGETPVDSCLREVREETGYHLTSLRFHGILTWDGFEIESEGLYIFSAPAPSRIEPHQTIEGELRWQPQEWVFTSPTVVDNIRIFGPSLFTQNAPRWWHFSYADDVIQNYQIRHLPAWVRIGGRRACC